MQVAMISYWSCPLTKLGVASAGGMNVYVLNLAQALGDLGHQVDIYTRVHSEDDALEHVPHQNVTVIHLPQRAATEYADVAEFAEQVIAHAERRHAHYALIHTHYFYSGLVGLILRERMGLPLLATFHTLGIMKKHILGTVDQRRIDAESAIIEEIDGIIASTELEKADVMEWHPVPDAKIHTVHPGVDHHLFQPHDRTDAREVLGLPQDEHLIVFVGRIDPIKGIDVLIDAFGILTEETTPDQPESKLILIGGDPDNEQFWLSGEGKNIRQQIDERQLADKIIFAGSQPQERLALYYAASDLVAMPSAYETFGFVALEAMACGACVVASRVGGLQYLIQDRENGRLFDPRNVTELAAIMRELLTDDEQRERLEANAATSSYRYCWSKQAEKMLAVYEMFV